MAEWVWLLSIFIALTGGYAAGWFTGSFKADRAPTAAAWRAVNEYAIRENKEVRMYEAKAEHEERMAMIERGCFDGFPSDDEDADEEIGNFTLTVTGKGGEWKHDSD